MDYMNLIELYVNDVIRRLPENERDEVSAELTSSILDMLLDEPDKLDVKDVLRQMGPPIDMARRYHEIPSSLMSPVAFKSFVNALKFFIPFFGFLFTLVGIIFSAVNTIYTPMPVGDILVNGVRVGLKITVLILGCMLVGYVIAAMFKEKKNDWKVEDLIEQQELTVKYQKSLIKDNKRILMVLPLMFISLLFFEKSNAGKLIAAIGLAIVSVFAIWDIHIHNNKKELDVNSALVIPKRERDEKTPSVIPDNASHNQDIDLMVTCVMFSFVLLFSTSGIWMCLDENNIILQLWHDGVYMGQIFDNTFLSACIPAIAVMGVFKTAECVLKFIYRRWIPVTYAAHIFTSVFSTCTMFYLLSRPAVFGKGLSSISVEWLQPISSIAGAHPLIVLCAVIVSAMFIIDCCYMINKILSTRKASVSSLMKA